MKKQPVFLVIPQLLEASFLLTGKKGNKFTLLLLWNKEMLREHLNIRYTSTKRNRVEEQALNETTRLPKFPCN